MLNLPKSPEMPALQIIKDIMDKKFDPKELLPKERRKIVAILRQDYTEAEIAMNLCVCDATIARDVRKIKMEGSKLVKDITLDTVVGEFIRHAGVLYSKAVRSKDFNLAWSIIQGVITKLQSLGLVKNMPARLSITGKVDHTHREIEEAPEEDLDSIIRQYVSGEEGGNGGRLNRESAPAHN